MKRLHSNDPLWHELDDCADEAYPTVSRRMPERNNDDDDPLDREVRDRLELNDDTVDQECSTS